jgi:hypothetical protein
MNNNPAFLELVQLHERMWGDEQYAGRPSLAQLLNAHIVALWSGKGELVADTRSSGIRRVQTAGKDANFLLTCYATPEELNNALTDLLLLRKVTPFAMRKLSKLYIDQKEVEIVGVKLSVKQKQTP